MQYILKYYTYYGVKHVPIKLLLYLMLNKCYWIPTVKQIYYVISQQIRAIFPQVFPDKRHSQRTGKGFPLVNYPILH